VSQCVCVVVVVVVGGSGGGGGGVVASVSVHRTHTMTCPSSCICRIHIGAVLPSLYTSPISTGLYRALLV